MTKNKLVGKIAMASLLACAATFAAGSANAALNMTVTPATGALTLATEIVVNGTTGTAIANPGNIMDVTSDLGFGITTATTVYVRYDLSNGAKFVADPTGCQLAAADNGVISQGGIGASYIIYSITAGADRAATADVVLTNAAGGIKVYNQSPVTLTYSLYETAGNAVAQTSALTSTSMTMASFGSALETAVNTTTTNDIDVTNDSVQFDATTNGSYFINEIGDIEIGVDGTTLWTDGLAAAMTDLVSAGTTLVITGDFTATQDLTDGAADGTYDDEALTHVYLDANGGCDNHDIDATAVTATTATLTLDQNAIAAGGAICLEVNGVSQVVDGAFTATYDVTVPATSDLADTSLGQISDLQKNGSTSNEYLALTPGGAFANYVRITNPSTVSGRVFITVYKDDGTSTTINLDDIAGQSSDSLAAQASTSLININDIYTATGWAAGYAGKLRLKIEGEFSSIDTQAISVATDGTSFSTF